MADIAYKQYPRGADTSEVIALVNRLCRPCQVMAAWFVLRPPGLSPLLMVLLPVPLGFFL
jgi:hypothetical protein